jgi:ribosome biogenesis protein SSF1/2
MKDMRRLMEPHTASKLRSSASNTLRDVIHVAGMFGVTHMLLFHKTEAGVNLRMVRLSHGPTLYFRVQSYVLIKDVLAAQLHARMPGSEFRVAPLLILHNFESTSEEATPTFSRESMKFKLLRAMFQNMFPSIDVPHAKVTAIRRVVLFHYNTEKDTIDMRHYVIILKPVGLSKSVKRLLHLQMPDLNTYDDIADYVIQEAAAISDSEVEDSGETSSYILLPESRRDVGASKKQLPAHQKTSSLQRSVKLIEMGPRLELQLIKIEKNLCGGEVLYHSYVQKTPDEVKALTQAQTLKQWTKESRKREQEENVKRKEAEREHHRRITSEGGRRGVVPLPLPPEDDSFQKKQQPLPRGKVFRVRLRPSEP